MLQYCRPAVELQLREALAEIARLKAQLDSQRRTARLAEGELKSALKVKEGEMATLRALRFRRGFIHDCMYMSMYMYM